MQEINSQNATNVIRRLKKLLKLKTDIQLSEFLNIRPNTISTWKKRNSLDYETIISICELYELDLNEVFLDQPMVRESVLPTPLVSREMQFQYAASDDRTALAEHLPKYKFPFISQGNSLAFQVFGNNMFPLIDENSFVICEESTLAAVREHKIAVIVSKQRGVFVNRVSSSAFKPSEIVLSNDNERYPDILLDKSEIDEVWLVRAILSYDLNQQGRISLLNDGLRKIDKIIKKNEIPE